MSRLQSGLSCKRETTPAVLESRLVREDSFDCCNVWSAKEHAIEVKADHDVCVDIAQT